jgi:hypothetical protein
MNPRSDLATEMTQDNSRVASEHMHENMRAAGDATGQVCAEIISRNAGTVQQALQSGTEIAVRMTEYSATNINAIVKSNVDLVDVTRTMSRDWMRFAQEGIERGLDWSRCLLQYRALSILPISKKKPCALVLMPLSGTHSATSPVRMSDEVTRTTATESTAGAALRRAA